MISAIDTCILLDVLLPDPVHLAASKALLDKAGAEGALVICEVVYAELACQFSTQYELDAFLEATGIQITRPGENHCVKLQMLGRCTCLDAMSVFSAVHADA